MLSEPYPFTVPAAWLYEHQIFPPFITLDRKPANVYWKGWTETPIYRPPTQTQPEPEDALVEFALSELDGSDFSAVRKHAATLRKALASRRPVVRGEGVERG